MLLVLFPLAFWGLAALGFLRCAGVLSGRRFRVDRHRFGRLQAEHAADHTHADIGKQVFKSIRGAALVLYQRVFLRVGFHADGDAQGFHTRELFDP